MKRASDKVEERLDRAASALSGAGIPYAVIGGLAVAAWVATVDEGAVRMTRDVDMLLNPGDLDRAKVALEAAGLVYRHVAGMDLFLDSPDAKAADSVHVLLAGQAVREGDPFTNPPIQGTATLGGVSYIALADLVKIKLTVWRDKDRVHLRDMIGVGLIDETWLSRLPPELASRLQELLDDPNG